MNKHNKAPALEVRCDGGCGKVQLVRKRRVHPATWYLCTWGGVCEAHLPKTHPGLVRVIEFNAAGSFYGITDRIPTQDERLSRERAAALRDVALSRNL
jgi:hypothetical protein